MAAFRSFLDTRFSFCNGPNEDDRFFLLFFDDKETASSLPPEVEVASLAAFRSALESRFPLFVLSSNGPSEDDRFFLCFLRSIAPTEEDLVFFFLLGECSSSVAPTCTVALRDRGERARCRSVDNGPTEDDRFVLPFRSSLEVFVFVVPPCLLRGPRDEDRFFFFFDCCCCC